MAPNVAPVQLGESKPRREYSNRYVEFLYTWDSSRRLRKPIAGPPEGYQHPNSIHGQRVVRLGKGIPPRDSQEDEQTVKTHRRRMVVNKSFEAHPDLLCQERPSTAPPGSVQLFLDETRQRALHTRTSQNNMSSMKGAGAMVTAEETHYKSWRGRGVANPSRGLSEEMLQTLQQMRIEPAAQQEPSARKLVWTVAPTPNDSTDGFLRHRMSDPALEARPVKFEMERPLTPNLQACSAEERRMAFFGSLQAYAKNKVVGDYGSLRTNSGLRTLAGFVR